MASQGKKQSRDGDGGSRDEEVKPIPAAAMFEMQKRQSQAVFEANRLMAEGVFQSVALLGDAASVVAESFRQRAVSGDLPFGPLSLWQLSANDTAKVQEDLSRSVTGLAASVFHATALLAEWVRGPAH